MKVTCSMLVNAVLATILLTSMFLISTTTSQGAYEYDQWVDLNDDGQINLYDAVILLTRYGTEGTPINKTDLLLELLDRVDIIEKEKEYTKTIRFFQQNETICDQPGRMTIATFIWTPNNATNNYILSIHCYFQFRGAQGSMLSLNVEMYSDIHEAWMDVVTSYEYNDVPTSYHWRNNEDYNIQDISPNQNNYTMKITVDGSIPAIYVKNLNLIIEVIDGLPAS